EKPRSIITRNESPDISFDRSINPYRGCEHGCVYCFARPTHSFMGLSPGLDFESKLFAKPDAARLLDKELSKDGYQPRTIAIGTNTDPYQPIEKQYRIMREILEVLE
ncbi:radical SAM protein, partial [bacterium M00.F.Ca.ET.228.01.1.1]